MTTHILAIIDPEETEHSALNRIREISPDADVDYKVDFYLDAVPVMAGHANTSTIREAVAKHREWLDGLVKPLRDDGYQIATEVIPFNRLYETIIHSARNFQADFVFKPVRQHGTWQRLFYTSNDWNLVRLCPQPLLMVSDEKAVHGKPVIAGIDIGDKDDAHRALNVEVVERAQLLATVLDSKVHVVYAFGPAAIASRSTVADPLALQIERGKYEEEFAATESFAAEYGIPSERVHLREGAPDHVVNDFAQDVGAGIVVLGTVARTGVSGLFIGNTAEAALERATTDVFVVKPPSFEPPV